MIRVIMFDVCCVLFGADLSCSVSKLTTLNNK